MRILTALIVIALSLQGAAASSNDRGPLTLVVGFAPGGTSSVAARFIADSVEKITVSSVIVENKPGAGGALAAEWVRRQTGSNTLFFMAATSVPKVPPSPDLVPVALLASSSYVVVARKSAPATLSEYLDAARQNDSLRNVATPGAGSVPHLIGARLFRDAGIVMEHIPYLGAAPAILSVVGGHVPLAIVPYPDFVAFTDTLRTVAETGNNGIEAEYWVGIFAPRGISEEEILRLSEIFRKASERSGEQLKKVGLRHAWKPAAELRRIHEQDVARWKPQLELLGIKP